MNAETLNSVIQLLEKSNKIVIVGDDLGTIRVFGYPNTNGQLYYQVLTDHLFSVGNMTLSSDDSYLLTQSRIDKSFIRYKVTYSQQQSTEQA